MNSVSTYGLNSTVLAAATQLQARLAAADVQEASGLVGQTYGDLGSQAGYVLDLRGEIGQSRVWADNATSAGDKVQAMYSAVGDMVDVMTSLRSVVSSAISSGDVSTLNTEASAVLAQLAELMNTEEGGSYLFAGSRTDTAPVDVGTAAYAASTAWSTASTSYYTGNDLLASVEVGTGRTITYGVSADNSAFEEALRVANVAASYTGSGTAATTLLQNVYDIATSAISALGDVQGTLSVDASQFTQIQEHQTSYLSLVETMVDDTQSVDTAAVAEQVSNYQAQLEASYSALAAITKVHLTNYL